MKRIPRSAGRLTLITAAPIAAALMAAALPAHAQTIVRNFAGNIIGGSGTTYSVNDPYIPPDTMGAVGNNHFVQFINGGYSVYSKTGTLLNASSPVTDDIGFWTAAGIPGLGTGTGQTQVSDPHILFDPASQHWFASEITIPANSTANQFLVAVSNTANPLDGFKGYSYSANTGTGTRFADFDMLGINSQGVYLGANNFNASGSPAGQNLLAISKAGLLSMPAANPAFKQFYNQGVAGVGFSARPVVDQDNGGTAANIGESLFGVSATAYGRGEMNQFTGSFAAGTVAVTTNGDNVTWSGTYRAPNESSQPGTAQTFDNGDDRFSSSVVKQNGVIYATQSIADPTTGKTDIHIIGVNAATNAKVLDQLLGDAARSYFFPSLAINASGDVVIGCSGSGPNQFASGFAFVGKLAADGTSIAFGSPLLTAQGQGSYFVDFGGGENRWGDYSATTLDPADPTKFWTVQEFAIAPNQWGTMITQIGIAAAPEPSAWAGLGVGALGLGALALKARRRPAV